MLKLWSGKMVLNRKFFDNHFEILCGSTDERGIVLKRWLERMSVFLGSGEINWSVMRAEAVQE